MIKHATLVAGLCLLGFPMFGQAVRKGPAPIQPEAVSTLHFEENKRQWPDQVRYKADVPGGTVWLENDRLTWATHSLTDLDRIHEAQHDSKGTEQLQHLAATEKVACHAWYVHFEGANATPQLTADGKQAAYSNYFIGNDPSRWAGNVGRFEAVTYQELYPGIALKAYSAGGNFKYDFLLNAGTDAAQLALRYEGVNLRLSREGNLLLDASTGVITEQAPVAWQEQNGVRIPVRCRYAVSGQVVRFAFPDGYNRNLPLVIDPVIVASTYSGSTATTYGHSATYDLAGNIYSGGRCFGQGYPATVGAYSVTFGGSVDIAISKYNPTGSALTFATYVGGSFDEYVHSMFVHTNGELYIYGSATSANYPTTSGAFDVTQNGSYDIVVTHFNTTGSALVGSTFVGGSADDGQNALYRNYGDTYRGEIVVDASGNAYVASFSSSTNFPTTGSAFDQSAGGAQDGVTFSINAAMNSMNWSTFVGGSSNDAALGLRVNSVSGEVFVCGGTGSSDFPITAGTYQGTYQGGPNDGFVVRISANGNTLLASSFYGTSGWDECFFLDLDIDGDVYVYGEADGGMPTTAGVFSVPNSGMFITKFDPAYVGRLFSTVIGDGSFFSRLAPTAFLVDICKNVYIAGFGGTSGYPVTSNAFFPAPVIGTCYLTVLGPNATSQVFGTFYGANHVDGGTSRFDPSGIVYHAVCQGGGGFPTNPNAYNTGPGPGWDVCVFKIDFEAVGVQAAALASPSDTGCAPYTVNFNNNGSTGNDYIWDFGDNSPLDTASSPTHTFTAVGTYTVTLIAIDSNSCNISDTTTLVINVVSQLPVDIGRDTVVCNTAPLALTANVGGATYSWSTGATTQGITVTQPGTYWVTVTTVSCSATDTIRITPLSPPDLGSDLLICPGESATIQPNFPGSGYTWSTGETTQSITVTQAGTYWVNVNVGPCVVSDTIVVDLGAGGNFQPINVFSPDGDGTNDAFDIGSPSPNNFDLVIYDRWGRLMFETTDPNVKWLGVFDQKAASEGVYYWVAHFENCLGEADVKTGFVHIAR